MLTETQVAVSVAWSEAPDPGDAALEAAAQAQAFLGGAPDAAVVFSAGPTKDALPRTVRGVLGPIPLAGCHAKGIITPEGVKDRGVAILALRAGDDLVTQTAASFEEADPWLASARVARLLLAGRPSRRRYPRGLALLFEDRWPAEPERWGEASKGWKEYIGSRVKTVGVVGQGPIYLNSSARAGGLSALLIESAAPIGVGVGMTAHPDGLRQAAREAVAMAEFRLKGQPLVAGIMVVSAPRSQLDGLESLRDLLGHAGAPLIGCLSEAAIGPGSALTPSLQTESVVVALIGEGSQA
jgi:small ligand-binding sensory domain FIST